MKFHLRERMMRKINFDKWEEIKCQREREREKGRGKRRAKKEKPKVALPVCLICALPFPYLPRPPHSNNHKKVQLPGLLARTQARDGKERIAQRSCFCFTCLCPLSFGQQPKNARHRLFQCVFWLKFISPSKAQVKPVRHLFGQFLNSSVFFTPIIRHESQKSAHTTSAE